MDTETGNRPAARYFVTAALDAACSSMLTDHVDVLRLAWRACRERYPFELTAGVILPDHLHCIVAIPVNDKHRLARLALLQDLFQHVVSGRPGGLWLDERPLREEAEVQRQIDYIHADPVRHGLARSPQKWPYSSLHAYIAGGLRPMYWSGGIEGAYGARAAGRSGVE